MRCACPTSYSGNHCVLPAHRFPFSLPSRQEAHPPPGDKYVRHPSSRPRNRERKYDSFPFPQTPSAHARLPPDAPLPHRERNPHWSCRPHKPHKRRPLQSISKARRPQTARHPDAAQLTIPSVSPQPPCHSFANPELPSKAAFAVEL